MNVLYVDGPNATLLTPTRAVQGPLRTLRALANSVKARGATVVVLSGALNMDATPTPVQGADRLAMLDTRAQGTVSVSGSSDTLYAVHDRQVIAQILAAARGSGLRLTELVPLASAALRATGVPSSAVIVHELPSAFDVTVASPAQIVTRTQSRSDRLDLNRVAQTALSRPLSHGDQPTLILIGTEDHLTAPDGTAVTTLTLDAALRGATTPAPKDQSTTGAQVASLSRKVETEAAVHPSLYVALGAAALINGGLFVFTTATKQQNAALDAQRVTLAAHALETQRLRASNDQLALKIKQAQTLMADKGPLAEDLPLIASRALEIRGSLVKLAGPNTPTETDTRAFGSAVNRTYDLGAVTDSPQDLVRAYQSAGLSVDVRNIDCQTLPCDVTFRTAPLATGGTQ